MSYNDYRAEVKKIFASMYKNLSDREIEDYLNEKDSRETIREDYNEYVSKDNIAGVSPASTASCLSMLY